MPEGDVSALRHLALSMPVHRDVRGSFVKVFGADILRQIGGGFEVAEVFWTMSERDVIRGLHFQAPPASVAKVVWCSAGAAFDVVVDLRPSSDSFGAWAGFEITPDNGVAVHVPHGFAHGFCALEPGTVIGYAQSGPFDPHHDAGVRWDSAGIRWPQVGVPIVSDRDRAFPALADLPAVFGS